MISKTKRTYAIVAATSLLALSTLAASLTSNIKNNVMNAEESTYQYSLTSSNAPEGLSTSEYSNLSDIDINTTTGNPMKWEYKYCKKDASAHAIIGNNEAINPDGTNFYVGNTTPFTGVKSVNVTFSGSDMLYVYGSTDATSYVRIADMGESGTVNLAPGYQYFRFLNGSYSKVDLVLTSVAFTYTCDHVNTSESADRSNNLGATPSFSYDYSTEIHRDGGSKSIEIVKPTGYSSNVYFSLSDSVLNWSDYSNYSLVFYARYSEDAVIDEGKTYDSIKTVLYKDDTQSTKFNGEYAPHLDTTYKSSWYKYVMPLATTFPNKNNYTGFQYVRIGPNYTLTAGSIFFDDIHLEGGDMRTPVAPENETNDLSNSITNVKSWNDNFTYRQSVDVSDSSLSSYSRKITCDDSGSKYPFLDSDRLGNTDNAGKVLTFDIKGVSNWNDSIQIKFKSGTKVCMARGASLATLTSGIDGLTYTALANDWYRVSMKFDTVYASKSTNVTIEAYSANSSSWYGFQFLVTSHSTPGIILVDNMSIA